MNDFSLTWEQHHSVLILNCQHLGSCRCRIFVQISNMKNKERKLRDHRNWVELLLIRPGRKENIGLAKEASFEANWWLWTFRHTNLQLKGQPGWDFTPTSRSAIMQEMQSLLRFALNSDNSKSEYQWVNNLRSCYAQSPRSSNHPGSQITGRLQEPKTPSTRSLTQEWTGWRTLGQPGHHTSTKNLSFNQEPGTIGSCQEPGSFNPVQPAPPWVSWR